VPTQEGTREIQLTGGRKLRFRREEGVWRVAIYRPQNEKPYRWLWFVGESTDPRIAIMEAFGRDQLRPIDTQLSLYVVEMWSL